MWCWFTFLRRSADPLRTIRNRKRGNAVGAERLARLRVQMVHIGCAAKMQEGKPDPSESPLSRYLTCWLVCLIHITCMDGAQMVCDATQGRKASIKSITFITISRQLACIIRPHPLSFVAPIYVSKLLRKNYFVCGWSQWMCGRGAGR